MYHFFQCMCNWAGVRCIQTHTRTHTHLAQLLQAMNPEWGERENGTISPASVIDLLLSTCRHSYECVRVCTCLCYRIHTKPLALLKRLYVSSTPPPPTHTHTHTIWCLLKQAVNSSLPSRELCKKKRCSHLTAWLSPLPQTAAGHVISRPWPVHKLIRRQADCWQLIILATPMSRGHSSSEKVFPVLPSSFSLPALLSYCWPSADELGGTGYVIYIFHVFFLAFFLRNLLFSGALHCSAGLAAIGDVHKVTFWTGLSL